MILRFERFAFNAHCIYSIRLSPIALSLKEMLGVSKFVPGTPPGTKDLDTQTANYDRRA